MKKLLKLNETLPVGLDVVRIISGGIIFSFGLEVFDEGKISDYTLWLTDVGVPFPVVMVYVGKFSELIFGLFLTVGLFTRLSTIPLMITMCVINFIMLDGSIRTETFYLLMIFSCFFFMGAGKLSLDFLIAKKEKENTSASLNKLPL
ncbi:hypothetical protein FUAX_19480 [Fulvitalea axinellae]|uniref:DoxX family protein n=1 Tax=Fulvitalea axinellae TaxID=1182444 RepID=A0AAU9CBG5_9BACT|nr:hypothetical protein FUAX_19480 [Fulvitalea axinellae]